MRQFHKLKLTRAQRLALQEWADGWGRLWIRELRRLWAGGESSLDRLWISPNGGMEALMSLKGQHPEGFGIRPSRLQD